MTDYLIYNAETDTYIAGSETVCGGKNVIPTVLDPNSSLPEGFSFCVRDLMKDMVDFTFICQDIKEYPAPHSEGFSCFWNGGIFDYGGYSTMNRNLIRRLNAMGANVKPISYVAGMDIEQDEVEEFVRYSKQIIPRGSPCVYASVMSRPYDGPVIHYTMMESDGQLNPGFLETLQHADEIWVPSVWNFHNFLNSGVKPPIYIMPLGVDVNLFSPENNQPALFSSGVSSMVILSVLSVQWRKGLDVLIKAYCDKFHDTEHTSLVLMGRESLGRSVKDEVVKLVKQTGVKNPPHIVVCETKIPSRVMPRFYNAGNIFALFSRGEGWGLPYCEAAACGLPIVGSEHGSQMMFLDKSDCYLVKPDIKVTVDKSMQTISNAYIGTTFADFSEDAIHQAGLAIGDAVWDCATENTRKARSCRKRVVENFSWDSAAKNVYNRLSEICNTGN